MASLPNISVIVPTFNRGSSLRRLLASLQSLEFPHWIHTELIVVDNGSTDGTPEILLQEQAKQNPFDFKFLKEATKGKSSALNRGIDSAQGEILIFVDDDVVADRQWLIKHWQCHEDTEFGAVQGRVLPGLDAHGRPADRNHLREYNIPIVDYGEKISAVRGFTGTNVSIKRDVIRQVGLFDPRLGPGALGFSEDTEYSIRMRKAGFEIGYAPDAVVFHELSSERYGRAYNRRVEYKKGLSRSVYRRDSIWFKVLPNLVAHCLRYGIYRLLGKSQKAYRTEGRILKCWGYLSGKLWASKLV